MADGRFRASLLKRGTALCWGRGAGARFGIAADAPTLVIFLSDSLRGSFFFLGTPFTPFIGDGILHAVTTSQSTPAKYSWFCGTHGQGPSLNHLIA